MRPHLGHVLLGEPEHEVEDSISGSGRVPLAIEMLVDLWVSLGNTRGALYKPVQPPEPILLVARSCLCLCGKVHSCGRGNPHDVDVLESTPPRQR